MPRALNLNLIFIELLLSTIRLRANHQLQEVFAFARA